MNIWLTEIGEPLPLNKDARLLRCGQLARYLAARGHQVTWWTSNFDHTLKTYYSSSNWEGRIYDIQLKVLAGPGYRSNISLARLLHQRNFAKSFIQLAQREKKPDLILSSVPCLEVAKAAVRFAKSKHVPVLIDIRDKWPDEYVGLFPRVLSPAARFLLTPAFLQAKFIFKNADGILGTSRPFLQYGLQFANRAQGAKDGVFPIGYSDELPDPSKVNEAKQWWFSQGISSESFIVCFFGSLGRYFDLKTVIKAVKLLPSSIPLKVVICGTGSRQRSFERLAKDEKRISFPGWVDASQITALCSIAKVGLAPYNENSKGLSLPNKPFEYMRYGLPILSSLEGELKGLIEVEACGMYYRSHSPQDLASAIQFLYFQGEQREKMGQNSRKLFEQKFSVEKIHRAVEAHFFSVVHS